MVEVVNSPRFKKMAPHDYNHDLAVEVNKIAPSLVVDPVFLSIALSPHFNAVVKHRPAFDKASVGYMIQRTRLHLSEQDVESQLFEDIFNPPDPDVIQYGYTAVERMRMKRNRQSELYFAALASLFHLIENSYETVSPPADSWFSELTK
jgi:hypothetical protein